MRRKSVGGKRYGRKFNKTARRTRSINAPLTMARGGFRF